MPVELRPIAVAFTALGSFLGTWAVVAADIERALGVSHGGFGVLLAIALGSTAGTGAICGTLVERFGVGRVLGCGCALFGTLVAVMAVAGDALGMLALAAVIVATYASSGLVDVSMNVAATSVLTDQPGKLVRFHAFFNAGAAMGAGLTAAIFRATDEWTIAFVTPMVLMAIAAVGAWRSPISVGETGEHHGFGHALRTVKAEGLVLLAAVFALSAMVEGGIDTWGVLVLREQLGVGLMAGALAHTVGQLVAATARATLGPAAGSVGTVRGVAVGSGMAACGLALLALAPATLAVAGLVIAAVGMSVCWPMLLAHASSGSVRPTGIVSGVTAIGYLGFVLGPALIGLVAEVVGLRPALLLLSAAAATVAVAPRFLGPRRALATSAT